MIDEPIQTGLVTCHIDDSGQNQLGIDLIHCTRRRLTIAQEHVLQLIGEDGLQKAQVALLHIALKNGLVCTRR